MRYYGRSFLIREATKLYKQGYNQENVVNKLVEKLDISLDVGQNIAKQAVIKKIKIRGSKI